MRQLIISTTDDVETIIEKESKLKNIKYMKTDEIYSDGYTNSLLDLLYNKQLIRLYLKMVIRDTVFGQYYRVFFLLLF